jgi:hypothetical protein
MNPSDEVWNRACAEAGGPKALTAAGDRALADMVLAHSLAMNAGVIHSIESLSSEQRIAAIAGYRYFGLDAAADVLEELSRRWRSGGLDDEAAENLETEADERYGTVVRDDDVLVVAFEARYDTAPNEFAPLD